MQYLTMGRTYLYDGTFYKPTTMGWLGFELSRTQPLANFTETIELAAASYLGQGNVITFTGNLLAAIACDGMAWRAVQVKGTSGGSGRL